MMSFEEKLDQALTGLLVEIETGDWPADRPPQRRLGRPQSRGPRGSVGRGLGSLERRPRAGAAPPPPPGGEISKYSLRFRFDDTLFAMAEVEGQSSGPYDDQRAGRWLDSQIEDRPGTATAARRKINEMVKLTPGKAHVDMDHGMEKVAVINGLDGNRWNVYLNGMVAFDDRYASSGGAIKKAQELGFDIDRDDTVSRRQPGY